MRRQAQRLSREDTVNINARPTTPTGPVFDTAKLDRLMEEPGIDVLLATSTHNTQYLLGGYRFIFFSAMDAVAREFLDR